MRGTSSLRDRDANNDDDRSGRGSAETGGGLPSADRADSEPDGWFAKLARPLLVGVDAGFVLNLLTGVHERSCYRYSNGERSPTGWLIRQLLWSEQGATWLERLMDGCPARWWRERSVIERKAALFDQAKAIFSQISV